MQLSPEASNVRDNGIGTLDDRQEFLQHCNTPVKRAADGDPSAGQHHLAWVTAIEVGLVPDTPTWVNSTGITTFDNG